ncbi:MAG: hypothetical protein RSB77_03175 [Bacilli bacterium]
MWSTYNEVYKNNKNESYIKNKRLEIVRYAKNFGIKSAARFYSCSKNTVK